MCIWKWLWSTFPIHMFPFLSLGKTWIKYQWRTKKKMLVTWHTSFLFVVQHYNSCWYAGTLSQRNISWWTHSRVRSYTTGFVKSPSTRSVLAWNIMWHSAALRAKFPNLLLSPYAPSLIKHLLHWHFLLCPLWQTASSGQQPVGSSPREVWSSQWSEWIRVMCDMQRRGSRMWQQLSFKVKLFCLKGEE